MSQGARPRRSQHVAARSRPASSARRAVWADSPAPRPAPSRRRAPPRLPPSHSPACRTNCWRYSAPDRSASCVGPAVISTLRPASGPRARLSTAPRWRHRISAGSAIRPGPNSPHAISPSLGPTSAMPSRLEPARDCAASPHAATCAHSWRARSAPSCRSPAGRSRRDHWRGPAAILAMRSAVAGATTTRSAERDNSIWPISISSVRLKRSV